MPKAGGRKKATPKKKKAVTKSVVDAGASTGRMTRAARAAALKEVEQSRENQPGPSTATASGSAPAPIPAASLAQQPAQAPYNLPPTTGPLCNCGACVGAVQPPAGYGYPYDPDAQPPGYAPPVACPSLPPTGSSSAYPDYSFEAMLQQQAESAARARAQYAAASIGPNYDPLSLFPPASSQMMQDYLPAARPVAGVPVRAAQAKGTLARVVAEGESSSAVASSSVQLAPVDPHADATSIFCDVVFVTSNESVSTPVGSIGVWCETAGEDVSHAERLPDPDSQTFFRANLLSIVRALEKAPFPKPGHPLLNKLCVKSKSEWLVDGLANLPDEFNARFKAGPGYAENVAMITYIRTLVQARSSHSQTVIFSLLSVNPKIGSDQVGLDNAQYLAELSATEDPAPEPDWDALRATLEKELASSSSTSAATPSTAQTASSTAKENARSRAPAPVVPKKPLAALGLGSSSSTDAKPKKMSMMESARRALAQLGSNAEEAVRESKTKGLIEIIDSSDEELW